MSAMYRRGSSRQKIDIRTAFIDVERPAPAAAVGMFTREA
jgi:hypothetical protein